MTEKEFKARCNKLGIAYSIKLWNKYVDACWDQIEAEIASRLDNSDKGVYTKPN